MSRELRVLSLGGALVLTGSFGFWALDGQRPVDAFYCASITLTTVGFGDICPAEKRADLQLFVAVLALTWVGKPPPRASASFAPAPRPTAWTAML